MDFGVGSIFSAINSAFIFADFIAKLNDVPAEARRFSTLIQRVRTDFYECSRLLSRSAVQARFESDPDERVYIHGTMDSVKSALADIGRFVEKIRVQDEGTNGSISMSKRMEWLWRYRSKVDSSERVLDTSHKSLIGAMHRMELWISTAPTSRRRHSGSSTPHIQLPSYQDAIRPVDANDGALDDDFIMSRRRRTKVERRAKPSAVDVKVSEVNDTHLDEIDATPEMSYRIYDAGTMPYLSPYGSTTSLASTTFSVRSDNTPYNSRPETIPSSRGPQHDPFPAFNDISRSVSARPSMMSLRSEYTHFTAPPREPPRQLQPQPPRHQSLQIPRGMTHSRTYSERSTYPGFGQERERPRSAMAERRDLRRASMRLVSGGYDATREI